MHKTYSTHHIVPKSQKGSDSPDNTVRLRDSVHIALHGVFANLTPQEQIVRLMWINQSALTQQFKDDVAMILQEDDPKYYYKSGVLIRKQY